MFFVSSSFKLAYVSAHKIRSFAFAASFLLFISFARQYIESNRGFLVSCVKYTFSNLFFFFVQSARFVIESYGQLHPSKTTSIGNKGNACFVKYFTCFISVSISACICCLWCMCELRLPNFSSKVSIYS